MSISEGKFKIGSLIIDRSTKPSEFKDYKDFELRTTPTGRLVKAYADKPTVTFLGMICMGEIEFFDGRLNYLKLVPFLADAEDFTFPTVNDQKARYELVRSELRKCYGLPDREDDTHVVYTFPGGSLESVMILKGRDRYMGGFIHISFEE